MNRKAQLIAVRAGNGDSKWCSPVGHLPAWSELPGSPRPEKVGYEGVFCTEKGKGILFIENHIFCLNILVSAFFFLLFLYVLSLLQRDSFYKDAFFASGMPFVFLSYTNPVSLEMPFNLSLMIPSVTKSFSLPNIACCFQAYRH